MLTYDLVSHGPNTAGRNECYGGYNTTTQTGWGPAYQNACIHSGLTENTDIATSWYNYTLAAAGSIIEENTTQSDPADNMTTATESVCPKGWTMPSYAQIHSIGPNTSSPVYVPVFLPTLGGSYDNGVPTYSSARGYWWSSEANKSAKRYYLRFDGTDLYTNKSNYFRQAGYFIRCVQKS